MKFTYSSAKALLSANRKTVVICFISALIILSLFAAYQYISSRPKAVVKYEGIALSMKMNEVMYVLGYPPVVLFDDDKEVKLANGEVMKGNWLLHATKKDIESSKNGVKDYLYWHYPVSSSSKRIDVEFDKATKEVKSIGCYVDNKAWVPLDACAINGIKAMDSEEVVTDRLGKPTFERIDGVTKNIKYSNLNMSIYLEQKNAYYIKVEKVTP
jgi:hypothetical protein